MQQEAYVFQQIESPWSRRTLVHLLLVFRLMRIDAFNYA